jgi:hypothetical protein
MAITIRTATATLAAVREELLVEDDLRSGMALAAALGDRF